MAKGMLVTGSVEAMWVRSQQQTEDFASLHSVCALIKAPPFVLLTEEGWTGQFTPAESDEHGGRKSENSFLDYIPSIKTDTSQHQLPEDACNTELGGQSCNSSPA